MGSLTSPTFTTLFLLTLLVLIIQCFSLPKGRPDGHDLAFDLDLGSKAEADLARPPLSRTKRYIGRVPVAYMKKSPSYPARTEPLSPSHFRERQHSPGESSLSDDELQALLYMLDNYQGGQGGQADGQYYPPQAQQMTTEELERLAQLLNVRKRETGRKRESHLPQAQQQEPLQFIRENYGRLEKVKRFPGAYYIPKQNRMKKDIDWSEYLGIDKRSPITITEKADKAKAKTEAEQKKLENLTTDTKQDTKPSDTPDKEWMMHEYFKNFALASSVRKKRSEVKGQDKPNDKLSEIDKLKQLETQMEKVGDKIIWDALKFTGAHKDEQLSGQEMDKVRANLIKKLATAYSLEKVREQVDELRQNLASLQESGEKKQ